MATTTAMRTTAEPRAGAGAPLHTPVAGRRHIQSFALRDHPVPAPHRRSRNHLELRRTVVCHRWSTVEEWVRNLDELAELTDAEIEDLARLDADGR